MADQTGLEVGVEMTDIVAELSLAADSVFTLQNLSESREIRIAKLAAEPDDYPSDYTRMVPGTRIAIDTGPSNEKFLAWTTGGAARLSAVEG